MCVWGEGLVWHGWTPMRAGAPSTKLTPPRRQVERVGVGRHRLEVREEGEVDVRVPAPVVVALPPRPAVAELPPVVEADIAVAEVREGGGDGEPRRAGEAGPSILAGTQGVRVRPPRAVCLGHHRVHDGRHQGLVDVEPEFVPRAEPPRRGQRLPVVEGGGEVDGHAREEDTGDHLRGARARAMQK